MKRRKAKKKDDAEAVDYEILTKDKGEADEWQYAWIDSLGFQPLDHGGHLNKHKARRLILLLKSGMTLAAVAKACCVRKWQAVPPSGKQAGFAEWKGVSLAKAKCRRDATLLIDATLEPTKFYTERLKDADKAKVIEDFELLAHDLILVDGVLPAAVLGPLVAECDRVWQHWRATGESGIPD